MRILASNPDTLGDVVLRQPLYRALLDAGHDLTLIIRPLLAPVIGCIAPGARILTTAVNLYDPRLAPESPELDSVVEAAKAEEPDLVLIAPYQWTALEERLSIAFPRARCIALSGKRFADPTYGPAPASKLRVTQRVEVAEDVAEARKNELLATAVLGRAVSLPDPCLEPASEHVEAARAHLAKAGLEPGGYWVACVGENQYTAVRNWRPERWSETLADWASRRGRRFLFVGHESERPTAEAIRDGMGDQRHAAAVWSGAGDGDLDVLLGLIALSAGYIGRDTGPMHLAAALRKPVIAVFGGGTWPRFLPAVDPSVAIAVGAPCLGCGWTCHLPESYCIKEVPVAEVRRAIDEIEEGRIARREARLLPPDGPLLSRIAREGAAAARERLTQLSVARRESMEQNESLAAVLERALKQAGRTEALAEELDATRTEMARREAILQQRLAAAENTFRVREEEMRRRIEELERHGAAPEALQAAVDERVRAIEAERERRDAETAARLHVLQAELAKANAELLQAKAEISDLRLKLARAEADRGTLSALARQKESEVVVLRGRVNDLLASRWRRYGQKLHLCMTLPWEKEITNGRH